MMHTSITNGDFRTAVISAPNRYNGETVAALNNNHNK